MTAPTLAERITAGAAVGRQIMERTGALFAVAQQAAAVEPLIAGFWQEGREQSRYAQRLIWTRSADDGLLPAGVDLAWLIDTASIMASAETYLLGHPDAALGPGRLRGLAHRHLDPPAGRARRGWPALPDPELVDERPPYRVVLVVTHPAA